MFFCCEHRELKVYLIANEKADHQFAMYNFSMLRNEWSGMSCS